MDMNIDHSWQYILPEGIDDLNGLCLPKAGLDGNNFFSFDPDICLPNSRTRDDGAAPNQEVIGIDHLFLL
jgi:hypothetical protein